MDVFEAVSQRISVRAYSDEAVPKEKLDKIWKQEGSRRLPAIRNLGISWL